MAREPESAGPSPANRPSGLSPEEKSNLRRAAIFVVAAIGFILGLKLLLGY
jgi:hypothetical protein